MIRFLIVLFSLSALASGDPYLVESKVQTDLEAALSRIIPREQFLVQVTAEIGVRSERKVVEGEMVKMKVPEQKNTQLAMPGFKPDVSPKTPEPPEQVRQVFRVVDQPVLDLVRVQVSLDQELAPPATVQAKQLVQTYLGAHYPNRTRLSFVSIPMLKPKLLEPVKEEPKAVPPSEETDTDWLKQYGVWIIASLGAIILLLLFRSKQSGQVQPQPVVKPPPRRSRPSGMSRNMFPWQGQFPGMFPQVGQTPGVQQATPNATSPSISSDAGDPFTIHRNRLLKKILQKADSFRLFFDKLSGDEKTELYWCLKGPAFDHLLLGLEIPRPAVDANEPQDLEEKILYHEKNFDEFTQTTDWQEKQFFGFLQKMSNEQLMTLVTHEDPLTACLMLRFMKANQSARVLDALPSGKRLDILSQLEAMRSTPLSEMVNVESKVRQSVERIPTHLFGVGAKKEDVDYWGTVLGEAENQDEILNDLEKTQPEIYPDLKKFKFKLEDAAALPDGILQKVLSETDNRELGLALSSCSKDVVDVILEALSPKRREVLENEMSVYKSAAKEEAREAKTTLTKRFREAMA